MAKAKKRAVKKKTSKSFKADEYAGLVTTEAKEAAIVSAGSARELNAMWSAWEKQGWSRDGQLYAAVVKQKKALGTRLSAEDQERLVAAEEARAFGAGLPPIEGRRP